ncbi:hypothetical protein PS15m_001687 [Mucor circinelloides]
MAISISIAWNTQNIIQFGNKLGSKIIREYYPKHLIKRTAHAAEVISCSFVEDNEFYSSIFDTLTIADESSPGETLAKVALDVLFKELQALLVRQANFTIQIEHLVVRETLLIQKQTLIRTKTKFGGDRSER